MKVKSPNILALTPYDFKRVITYSPMRLAVHHNNAVLMKILHDSGARPY